MDKNLMSQYDAARTHMVDSQVRPNQVNDARVVASMRALPREAFAPAGCNPYTDTDIPFGNGRFLLAPMLIARLVQLVLATNPKHVLVIGAGTGYGAAIIAASGAHVVALEDDKALQTDALARYAPLVKQVSGPLAAGWPADGPYDTIFIEGATPKLPPHLAAQLNRPGQLVAILAQTSAPTGLGCIVLAEPSLKAFGSRAVFDCTARILPAFQPAEEFVF